MSETEDTQVSGPRENCIVCNGPLSYGYPLFCSASCRDSQSESSQVKKNDVDQARRIAARRLAAEQRQADAIFEGANIEQPVGRRQALRIARRVASERERDERRRQELI